ncbi:hypothetical protein JGK43_002092 [Edwardsiella piscicida]|nr:hypothetical protein [Edwardsiella piscicida]ELM3729619.1 hypothetical protein [Edwardsiella piscicida]ELV7536827.1 hypothetical protein [Edwardsiella piscicida]
MEKKAYLVLLGFDHPNSGHWQEAGTIIEMSESEATQLVLSGYLIAKPVAKRK